MTRVLLSSLLIFFHSPANAEEDSWTFNPEPEVQIYSLPTSDSIMKWCDDTGRKVRYAKDPVPGYRLCGEVETQKLCDPSGRRYIGSTGAPYAYKDCSIGERIIVTRHEPVETPTPLPAGPMTDIERLEAHKKIEEIKMGESGELARELQGLSRDITSMVRELRKSLGGKVD